MKVLMTGATGLIGKELGKALVARDYKIFVVSRDATRARSQLPFPCEIIEGDLSQGSLTDHSELRQIDVVINLAGENIGGGRWNEARKRKIYESRILTTRNLIQSLPVPPKVFISASAVGYYGSQGDSLLTEDSPAGDDFLSQVCQDWEEELLSFSYGEALSSTRVVIIRTGLVLAPQGGALEKLSPLFHRGLGSILGEGKQWMSWIHLDDEVGLILHAIQKSNVRGPMNLVSPNPVTNEEFSKTLAMVFGVKLAPRVPAMLLVASLGEMSSLVLGSQRVVPQIATQTGYVFKFSELKPALENLCFKDEAELFVSEQYVPWPVDQVFKFFSHPENLQKITPSKLEFELISKSTEKIQNGSEFVYKLKLRGMTMKWKSQIEDWNPPHHFTDIQLEGPCTMWRHRHEFRSFAGGTLIIDRVHYILPMGSVGSLLGGSLVRSEIAKSFVYRREHLIQILEKELRMGTIENEIENV